MVTSCFDGKDLLIDICLVTFMGHCERKSSVKGISGFRQQSRNFDVMVNCKLGKIMYWPP
jgi:hypothetical protein